MSVPVVSVLDSVSVELVAAPASASGIGASLTGTGPEQALSASSNVATLTSFAPRDLHPRLVSALGLGAKRLRVEDLEENDKVHDPLRTPH